MVDAGLLQKSRELALTSASDVAHINAKHHPPLGLRKPRKYRDGCSLTPVYRGCLIYSRED